MIFGKKIKVMSEEKELTNDLNPEVNSETQETVIENDNLEATSQEEEEQKEEEITSEPSAEDKIAELNDKYLRLYSEFDNYRKRTNKEKLDLITNASSSVIKDMIVILDDFDRAIKNNETSEDINGLKEGFVLIQTKLKGILESKGLKPMVCKGETFDSELHEAIANMPASTDELKNKIIEDVEKGYFLNEKVIRYAKVVVGQ